MSAARLALILNELRLPTIKRLGSMPFRVELDIDYYSGPCHCLS
jgi:hypothetical protein